VSFVAADAVFDAGVGAVAGLQPLQRPDLCVGDERRVPPAIAFGEQRQLRAGVWASRRTMTRITSGQPDRSSSPVSSATCAPSRTPPSAPSAGGQAEVGSAPMAARSGSRSTSRWSTPRPAPLAALLGQPVQHCVRGSGGVAAHQQMPAMRGGDLRDRFGQHHEVVGGGVRPGVARPQLQRASSSFVLSQVTRIG
jgi:hypothetical protein